MLSVMQEQIPNERQGPRARASLRTRRARRESTGPDVLRFAALSVGMRTLARRRYFYIRYATREADSVFRQSQKSGWPGEGRSPCWYWVKSSGVAAQIARLPKSFSLSPLLPCTSFGPGRALGILRAAKNDVKDCDTVANDWSVDRAVLLLRSRSGDHASGNDASQLHYRCPGKTAIRRSSTSFLSGDSRVPPIRCKRFEC
jgi:hypothetical protein